MQAGSLLFALFAIGALALGYRRLRRARKLHESAPQQFFEGMDDETVLNDGRRAEHR